MTYEYVMETNDLKRIDKLNKLTDKATFWQDVRKMTRCVHTDHALGRWQVLAEARYEEIK